MTLSAKWTAVSLFAITTALAAGSVAFAGCTVTSGTPDDIEGGTGNPRGTGDSGTADAAVALCQDNKQVGDFVSPKCQAKLSSVCCKELTDCFNIVVESDGGASDNCQVYSDCVANAQSQPESEKQAAQEECDLGAPQAVKDAYGLIEDCATAKASDDCQ